jgi:hypothetical protein
MKNAYTDIETIYKYIEERIAILTAARDNEFRSDFDIGKAQAGITQLEIVKSKVEGMIDMTDYRPDDIRALVSPELNSKGECTTQKCPAMLELDDDYGDNLITMHCQLEKGHVGLHEEIGLCDRQKYKTVWSHLVEQK